MNQIKSAVLSEDRRYRYELWRGWGWGDYCCFIGLNPSTADEETDDQTIRVCRNFAKAWGYDGLCMLNLFAFRATKPEVMKREADPIGEKNDETLLRLTRGAGIVIAAWGIHGTHRGRDAQVIASLPTLHCLAHTKDGHPRHPLRIPRETKPILLKP